MSFSLCWLTMLGSPYTDGTVIYDCNCMSIKGYHQTIHQSDTNTVLLLTVWRRLLLPDETKIVAYLSMVLPYWSMQHPLFGVRIKTPILSNKGGTEDCGSIGLQTLANRSHFEDTQNEIQSTLVISNSKGLSEILRDIRSSTYQVCRIEEKIIWLTTFNKLIGNWTFEVRDILKILWKRGEIAP